MGVTYQRRKAARQCVRCARKLVPREGVCCEDCAREHSRYEAESQRRHMARRLEQQRKYYRAKSAKVRAAGICRFCSDPAKPGTMRCVTCLAIANEKARIKRAEQAAQP